MDKYIILFILVFVIVYAILNIRVYCLEKMSNLNKSKNSIINNLNPAISNESNLDLFDDTIVRIKVHKMDFNWNEPYTNNPAIESVGTGFFIDNKGHILTNHHVVKNCIKVFIQLPKYGGKTTECKVVSVHPKLDIAILKSSEHTDTKFLELGDSEKIIKGNDVMAVGYPLGQDKIKVTVGVVSGFQDGDIQMDSPINPGNSGGPLIKDNKVIGINYAGYNYSQNVGYAIPIEYVKINMEDMFQKEFINFPVLGATFNNSNETMMQVASVCPEGYYISKVLSNGTMDSAGIKQGDIICQFDGLQMDNYGEVYLPNLKSKFHISDYMKYKRAGDKVPIEVVRNNKVIKTILHLQDNSFYKIKTLYPNYDNIDYQLLGGLVIMPLTNNHLFLKELKDAKHLQKYNSLEEKQQERLIIVDVMKGSKMAETEMIYPPLVLTKVNGMEVNSLLDLRRVLILHLEKDNIKYFSFQTENDKFFMLELNETIKEEEFLSQKFNYSLSDYTQKLLGIKSFDNNNKRLYQLNKNEDSPSPSNNKNNLDKTIYTLLSNNAPTISPLTPLSPSLTPMISLTPIDSTLTPAPEPNDSNLSPNESNLLPNESNLSPFESNNNVNNLSPNESNNNVNNLSPFESNLSPNESNNNVNNLSPNESNLAPNESNNNVNNFAINESNNNFNVIVDPSINNVNTVKENEKMEMNIPRTFTLYNSVKKFL